MPEINSNSAMENPSTRARLIRMALELRHINTPSGNPSTFRAGFITGFIRALHGLATSPASPRTMSDLMAALEGGHTSSDVVIKFHESVELRLVRADYNSVVRVGLFQSGCIQRWIDLDHEASLMSFHTALNALREERRAAGEPVNAVATEEAVAAVERPARPSRSWDDALNAALRRPDVFQLGEPTVGRPRRPFTAPVPPPEISRDTYRLVERGKMWVITENRPDLDDRFPNLTCLEDFGTEVDRVEIRLRDGSTRIIHSRGCRDERLVSNPEQQHDAQPAPDILRTSFCPPPPPRNPPSYMVDLSTQDIALISALRDAQSARVLARSLSNGPSYVAWVDESGSIEAVNPTAGESQDGQ